MARKLGVEKVGFYHVLNRGVARSNIYLCDDDFLKFLEIIQDASDEYDFQIDSFCLMNNHYHLLLETNKENLSIIMQKINSRYSIYFNKYPKEQAIYNAIKDGYTGNAIAKHLTLSPVSISKILKNYREKVKLFNKLKDKNIFWSYSKSITYDMAGEILTIEYLFKYGDFDEIQQGFELFGKRVMKRVWEDRLKSDKRFIKLNFMLARVFFDMNVEASYFKEVKNARFEKLKLLAS